MPPIPTHTYHVNHSRKGKFTMRVDSLNGEWVSDQVVAGTAKAMLDYNVKKTGEDITVRLSLCQFTPVTP